jgi:hypothetical protein
VPVVRARRDVGLAARCREDHAADDDVRVPVAVVVRNDLHGEPHGFVREPEERGVGQRELADRT